MNAAKVAVLVDYGGAYGGGAAWAWGWFARRAGDLSMGSSSDSDNEGPHPAVGGKVRAAAPAAMRIAAQRLRRLVRC